MNLEFWSFIVDVSSLIVGIASLAVTIVLTIKIYQLERDHEKEREKLEDEAKKQAIDDAAKVFLIDNDEEVEYLPLSVVAKNLNLKRKHCRTITTRFLRCSDDVQGEILRQANFRDIDISTQKIENDLKLLERDMQQHEFGRSILYDGAKYFHRAIERYSDVVVENANPCDIEDLRSSEWYGESSPILLRFSNGKSTLYSYIYNYLHPWELNTNKNHISPPIEMLFSAKDLGSCDESIMTFWTMRIIIDSCRVLTEAKDAFDFDESLIKTQEDMYYYTVLVLHKTYGSKETGVNYE